MNEIIKLNRVSHLSEADRAEISALSLAVYPPEEAGAWQGRFLEWADPEWCVRIWSSGGELASYASVHIREGPYDSKKIRIGGVGGIKTHPAARRRRYAEKGLWKAVDFFRENPEVTFALLVCEKSLVPYYARLGWHEFHGELGVRQYGEPAVFTFNRVMTYGIAQEAPTTGVIDLCGPPW